MPAIVVIGRNEGERLRRCLESLPRDAAPCVYVDSGSTDGSPDLARGMGCEVVELDRRQPFTAARGRNAGLARLLDVHPTLEYVQFVDGDCEILPGWIKRAVNLLESRPELAATCGRLRERHPTASMYHRLCDIEWDRPPGETEACGGIAMLRVSAFRQVGGFRESLAAGEEPELCFRLRQAGWHIWRDEAEMATHEAAMSRFSQWWFRAIRSGRACMEGAWLEGLSMRNSNARQIFSIIAWAAGLPAAVLAGAWLAGGVSLLALSLYPLQVAKIAVRMRYRGRSWADSWLYGLFTVLGKFAELWGLLQSMWRQGRRALMPSWADH